MDGAPANIETIVIPGELWLSNPLPPPITVSVPVVAWAHGPWNFFIGCLFLFLGMACVLTFSVSLLSLWHIDELSWGLSLLMLACLWCSIYFGGALLGAVTCFWDAVRDGPALEITAEGLRDHRSNLSVPWSSVKRAWPLGGGIGIDLELNPSTTYWQNLFRVGIFLHRFWPKPGRVIVPIIYLDVSQHVVASSILTLVRWHGGEVLSTPVRVTGPQPAPKPLLSVRASTSRGGAPYLKSDWIH